MSLRGNTSMASLTTQRNLAVAELRRALNGDAGNEPAANLDRFYRYLHDLLVKGLYENRTEPLEEAQILLNELRSAWTEVSARSKGVTENGEASGSNTIAPPQLTVANPLKVHV